MSNEVLLAGTLLVNQGLLVQFIGLGPAVLAIRATRLILGLALLASAVLLLSSLLDWLLIQYWLRPYRLESLSSLGMLVSSGVLTQAAQHLAERQLPLLVRKLGLSLPWLMLSTAVLGKVLVPPIIHPELAPLLWSTLALCGLLTGLWWGSMALYQRLESASVPVAFRGLPIRLLTAGLLSLGWMAGMGWPS